MSRLSLAPSVTDAASTTAALSCTARTNESGSMRPGGEIPAQQRVDYEPVALSAAPGDDASIVEWGKSARRLLRLEVCVELGARGDANGHALRVAPESPDELELLIVVARAPVASTACDRNVVPMTGPCAASSRTAA